MPQSTITLANRFYGIMRFFEENIWVTKSRQSITSEREINYGVKMMLLSNFLRDHNIFFYMTELTSVLARLLEDSQR